MPETPRAGDSPRRTPRGQSQVAPAPPPPPGSGGVRRRGTVLAALLFLPSVLQVALTFALGGLVGPLVGVGVGIVTSAVLACSLLSSASKLTSELGAVDERARASRGSPRQSPRGSVAAPAPSIAHTFPEVASLGHAVGALQDTIAHLRRVLEEREGVEPPASDSEEEDSEEEEQIAPEGEVTIIFTDIQSSTKLWEQCSEAMDEALSVHNAVIRKNLRAHKGYEVKTIGDAFMIAFASGFNAVSCALSVQNDLVEKKWPKQLESCDAAECENLPDGRPLWSGLRVRIGAHIGQAILEHNPLTDRADYRGPTVNKAARVEGQGQGGMLVVTEELYKAIEPRLRDMGNPDAHDLGQRSLKGVKEPVHLYVLLPQRLKDRWRAFGTQKKEERPVKRRVSRKFIMTPGGMVEVETTAAERAPTAGKSDGQGTPTMPTPGSPPTMHKPADKAGRGAVGTQSSGKEDDGARASASLEAFGMPAVDSSKLKLSKTGAPYSSAAKIEKRAGTGGRERASTQVQSQGPPPVKSPSAAGKKMKPVDMGGIQSSLSRGESFKQIAQGLRKKREVPPGLRRRSASVVVLQVTTQRGPAAGGDVSDLSPQDSTLVATELLREALVECAHHQGVIECAGACGVTLSWNALQEVPLHANQSLRFAAAMHRRTPELVTCGIGCGSVLTGATDTEARTRMMLGKAPLLAQALAVHAAAWGTYCLVADASGLGGAQSPIAPIIRFLRPADVWLDDGGATLTPMEPDLSALLDNEADNGIWDCLQGTAVRGDSPRASRALPPSPTASDGGEAAAPLRVQSGGTPGEIPRVLSLSPRARNRRSFSASQFNESAVGERGDLARQSGVQHELVNYKRNFHGALSGSSDCLARLRVLAAGEPGADGERFIDPMIHKVVAALELHQKTAPAGQVWRVPAPWVYTIKLPPQEQVFSVGAAAVPPNPPQPPGDMPALPGL